LITQHTTETNTIALIRNWSMAGARRDLGGHFGSPVDIHAAVAERDEESRGDASENGSTRVMMKPAGEDDWRPLLVGVSSPA
jgi:hypothetical protein